MDLRLVLQESLDREMQDTYLLTVIAVDGGVPPRSGSMAVQVQVLDANDNSPVFTQDEYEVRIPAMAQVASILKSTQFHLIVGLRCLNSKKSECSIVLKQNKK